MYASRRLLDTRFAAGASVAMCCEAFCDEASPGVRFPCAAFADARSFDVVITDACSALCVWFAILVRYNSLP